MVVGVRPGGGWVHSDVPWGSLGSPCSLVSLASALPWWSLGVFRFTRERTAGRWVHPWSFDFLIVGIIQGRWVHSGVTWGCFLLSGIVGLTRVRSGGR